MDVGGEQLHRAGDQRVDQADDRRLARQVLQPFQVRLATLIVAFAERGRRSGRSRRRPSPYSRSYAASISAGSAARRSTCFASANSSAAQRRLVQRIGHRHDDRSRGFGQRHHSGPLEETPGRAAPARPARPGNSSADTSGEPSSVGVGARPDPGRRSEPSLAAIRSIRSPLSDLEPPHPIQRRAGQQAALCEQPPDRYGLGGQRSVGHDATRSAAARRP